MLADVSANAVVYQVLDDIIGTKCVPPGARAALFEIVDELRWRGPTAEAEVARSREVAHRLRRGDVPAADASREQLKTHAAEWINMRISSRH